MSDTSPWRLKCAVIGHPQEGGRASHVNINLSRSRDEFMVLRLTEPSEVLEVYRACRDYLYSNGALPGGPDA